MPPPSAAPIGALLAAGCRRRPRRRAGDRARAPRQRPLRPALVRPAAVEAPEEIVETHLAYFRAGARVATTASYQASFEGFAERGIDHAGGGRAHAPGASSSPTRLGRRLPRRMRSERAAIRVRSSWRPRSDRTGRSSPTAPSTPARTPSTGRTCGTGTASGSRSWPRRVRTSWRSRRSRRSTRGVRSSTSSARSDGPPAWLSFTCADGARPATASRSRRPSPSPTDTPRVIAVGVNCTAPEHVRELVERARRGHGQADRGLPEQR